MSDAAERLQRAQSANRATAIAKQKNSSAQNLTPSFWVQGHGTDGPIIASADGTVRPTQYVSNTALPVGRSVATRAGGAIIDQQPRIELRTPVVSQEVVGDTIILYRLNYPTFSRMVVFVGQKEVVLGDYPLSVGGYRYSQVRDTLNAVDRSTSPFTTIADSDVIQDVAPTLVDGTTPSTSIAIPENAAGSASQSYILHLPPGTYEDIQVNAALNSSGSDDPNNPGSIGSGGAVLFLAAGTSILYSTGAAPDNSPQPLVKIQTGPVVNGYRTERISVLSSATAGNIQQVPVNVTSTVDLSSLSFDFRPLGDLSVASDPSIAFCLIPYNDPVLGFALDYYTIVRGKVAQKQTFSYTNPPAFSVSDFIRAQFSWGVYQQFQSLIESTTTPPGTSDVYRLRKVQNSNVLTVSKNNVLVTEERGVPEPTFGDWSFVSAMLPINRLVAL